MYKVKAFSLAESLLAFAIYVGVIVLLVIDYHVLYQKSNLIKKEETRYEEKRGIIEEGLLLEEDLIDLLEKVLP